MNNHQTWVVAKGLNHNNSNIDDVIHHRRKEENDKNTNYNLTTTTTNYIIHVGYIANYTIIIMLIMYINLFTV